MEKLYSVKKPKSLVSVLFLFVLIVSILCAIIVISVLAISYFTNHKTDLSNDLVLPILRSLLLILPIDALAVFFLISLTSIYKLGNKNRVFVKSINSFFDYSRSNVICLDECEMFLGDKCLIKEITSIGQMNQNEVVDIAGSLASLVRNDDPVILALQELSYIPLFNHASAECIDGSYQVDYKDKKYVLGKLGAFKYRAEEFVKTKVKPYLLKGYEITLVGCFNKDTKNDKYAEFADVFGIIVTKNAANPEYKQAIEYFQSKGIEIKILSSGNAFAACENAKMLGVKNADKYIIGRSYSDIDENVVRDYVVFANLSEEGKCHVVSLLQKDGKVVTSLGKDNVLTNSQCSISLEENGDIIVDEKASLTEAFDESNLLRNKLRKLFALSVYKTVFVDMYLIVASLFTLGGFSYVYKPVVLGTIFITVVMVALVFDNTHEDKNRRLRYRVLSGFVLELLALGVIFSLFLLQYKEITYTGLGDFNACMSMCGITFTIAQLVFLYELFIPYNKRRVIIFSSLSAFIFAVVGVLFGVSIYLNKELFGIAFNKFNGQNLIHLLIILVIFSVIYFVINYLLDNYKKGGDK